MSAPVTAAPPPPPAVPPCPLPADLRSDVAQGRAEGHSWATIGAALGFEPGALRRATERDPEYPAAEDRARASELRAAEGVSLQRLRQVAASDDTKLALRAAEVVLGFVGQCRREEARKEVERVRAEVEQYKADARAKPVRAFDSGLPPLDPLDPLGPLDPPRREVPRREVSRGPLTDAPPG